MTPLRLAALPLLFLLAACGSTPVALPYAPTTAVQPVGRPLVALAGVTNDRQTGREDPRWLGTIRGGYGNPIRTLTLDEPIDRAVAGAFQQALAARGLAGGSRYALAVTIHEFNANQLVRREATADFSAVLVDRTTGREVWRDRESAYNVAGSLLSVQTGVFASAEDLRLVAVRTMNQAIDGLLSKPGFLAAIRG